MALASANPQLALGAGDPAGTGRVIVLPPPPGQYETRSPALPVTYDLAFKHGRCVAIRRDDGGILGLGEIECLPNGPKHALNFWI
jgi:hypothetical protein